MHYGSNLELRMTRVILFVEDIERAVSFYRDVLGLPRLTSDADGTFVELDAGACRIALHTGKPSGNKHKTPKIVFAVPDVVSVRDSLIEAGVTMGPLHDVGHFAFSDGRDPDGNTFQISSRP